MLTTFSGRRVASSILDTGMLEDLEARMAPGIFRFMPISILSSPPPSPPVGPIGPSVSLQSTPLPPPVSSQSTPTPQVTAPATPPPTYVYISSGGGTVSPAPASQAVTQSPATSTVAPAAASVTDQVAAWLGGTTPIGTWNVPNALLAGGVVLGFALLMGGGGKKR